MSINTQELTAKLLSTNYFVDNEYLKQYVKLCTAGSLTKTSKALEAHHILQFSYFTLIDNITAPQNKTVLRRLSNKPGTAEYSKITKNNLVYFSYFNHCLAHYYLYRCTLGKLKIDNEVAFCKMTDRNLTLRDCSESEVIELLQALQALQNDPASIRYQSLKINQAIEEWYPIGGYKLVLEHLKALGIVSSKNRIKSRAIQLGVRGANYVADWTAEELQIIKEKYVCGGYKACQPLLPNRSKYAIQARAKYLGIEAPGASKVNAAWSEAEINIIKQYYPIGGTVLCRQYLPTRSKQAIKAKANCYMGVYVVPSSDKRGVCKQVYELSIDNVVIAEYASIKEASVKTGISTPMITACCNGKRLKVKGRYFCFKDNYTKKQID